jgi:isopenicillin N synthase-like dioxygenase
LYSCKLQKAFSSAKGVSVVETANFLKRSGDYKEDCKKVAKSFEETGCLVIRDPRVNQSHNDEFLNMMETYFEGRSKLYYGGQKNLEDFYPQYGYQAGATPEGVEKARDHKELIDSLTGEHKPVTISPPPIDAKWRFFWRIGERPKIVDRNVINPPQHIPKDFPQWETIMDRWGNLMHDCVYTVSEMLATGFGLPENSFSEKMKYGAHLLAPTGSDLQKYQKGTVFAGFHYDLNYITIHGKSRFPGLAAWLREGKRFPVVVPDGCLLLQSGKQLEYLTGGHIQAGFHEVIYNEETDKAKLKAIAEGKSTWRISSTLFAHIRQDCILEPLNKFSTTESKAIYKPISAGEQVEEELRAINLLV